MIESIGYFYMFKVDEAPNYTCRSLRYHSFPLIKIILVTRENIYLFTYLFIHLPPKILYRIAYVIVVAMLTIVNIM